MQGFPSVAADNFRTCRWNFIQFVNIGSRVEKAFRTEEKSVLGVSAPRYGNVLPQLGVKIFTVPRRGKAEIFRSSLGIKTARHSYRFDKGGLSGSVFANKKCNVRINGKRAFFLQEPDSGNFRQIGIFIGRLFHDYLVNIPSCHFTFT
jgi:hypothetical protein